LVPQVTLFSGVPAFHMWATECFTTPARLLRPSVMSSDGELADAGWGTSFTPHSNGRYKLKVIVGNPDPAGAEFRATLSGERRRLEMNKSNPMLEVS